MVVRGLSMFSVALYAFMVWVLWLPSAGKKESTPRIERAEVMQARMEKQHEEDKRIEKRLRAQEESYAWGRGTGEEKERKYYGWIQEEGSEEIELWLYREKENLPYAYGRIARKEVQDREERGCQFVEITCQEGAMRVEKIRKNLLESDMTP